MRQRDREGAGWRWRRGGLAALAVVLLAACQPRPDLLPVPPPELADVEKSIQVAVVRGRQAFDAKADRRLDNAELGRAYGELAMLYHAQGMTKPAEPAYQNARRLLPADPQWPYLLGQLYNDSARPADAVTAFEAALQIAPTHVQALHALGRTALQTGDLDRSQGAFQRLLDSTPPARAAALAGLGKVALARNQPAEAAARLEEALRLAPRAVKLRQPLAQAYRAAGDTAKAEVALRGFDANGPEPVVPEPLAETLSELGASSRALVRRGYRRAQEGRFDLAAAAFEAAADGGPPDPRTLTNLGIAWANIGRLDDAARVLELSSRLAVGEPLTLFSLGLVYDRQGRDADAIAQYRQVLERDPQHEQAALYMADALLRMGRSEEAVAAYKQALAQRVSDRTELSLAIAMVRAGQYADARKRLEAGLAHSPGNPGMVHALVRVLAAAPDAAVRDGARARQLGQTLFEAAKSPDVAESLAMAHAESGDFDRALALQKQAIADATQPGQRELLPFMQANLALYQAHQPSRRPWADNDAIFQPRSAAAARAAKPVEVGAAK